MEAALRGAHRAGDAEAARRIAARLASEDQTAKAPPARRAPARFPPPEDPSATPSQKVRLAAESGVERAGEFASGALSGAADITGLPADILLGGLELAGAGPQPSAREALKEGMRMTGADVRVENLPGKVGEFMGSGGVAVGGLFSKAAQSSKLLGPMAREAARRPGTAALTEATGATGGATAEFAAEQQDAGQGVQAVAALLGSVTAAGAVQGLSGAARIMPKSRASQFVKESAMNPEAASARLRSGDPVDVPGVQMTSGAASGDIGLMQVERSVALNPRTQALYKEVQQANRQALHEGAEAVAEGQPEAMRDLTQRLVSDARQRIEKHATRAVAEATEALRQVSPDATPEQAAIAASRRLVANKTAAKNEMRARWKEVPLSETVTAKPVKEALSRLEAEATKADLAMGRFVPDSVVNLIKSYPDKIPAREIHSLRSNLLEDAGIAPYAGVAKALGELQDAAVTTLNRHKGGAEYKAAREFTRRYHETFNEGPIGEVLRLSGRGRRMVPEEMTLDRVIVPGRQGGSNMDDYLKAGGDPDAAREFLTHKFAEKFQQGGPSSRRKFLSQYSETLDRMPNLKEALSRANSLRDVADIAERNVDKAVDRLTTRTRAGVYMQKDPAHATASVFNSGDPVRNMRKLVRMTARDPTGKAIAGLRRSVVDHVLRKAEGFRAGSAEIRSSAMERFMRNNRETLRAVLTPEQIARLDAVREGASMGERVANLSLRGGSDTVEKALGSQATQLPARFLGTRVGRKIGGGTIQIPGMMGNLFARMAERFTRGKALALVEEAIFDPKKMADLLDQRVEGALLDEALQGHLVQIGMTDDEAP